MNTPNEHSLIEDSVTRLFASQATPAQRARTDAGEFNTDLWQQVVAGGYTLLTATEAAGGLAQPWAAAFAILRGLGYWQVPLPLAETLVAANVASLAGLPVPEGPLTLIEQGCGNDLHLTGTPGAERLSGTAHAVPWARHASTALVSLADGRLAWLPLAGAPGVVIQPHSNHAGWPSDSLQLTEAPLQTPATNLLALAQPVWTLGAMARSAMLAGALESALDQAVRYAGERVQFGKPIAAYQAIQQSLALMAGDVAAARLAALVACADGPSCLTQNMSAFAFSAAVAKVRAGEAATRGAGIAHQVHGAIGFTHEHNLHRATRCLWAWREEFGTDAHWAAVLGRAAIQQGASNFWPQLTRKNLA